ncbi:transcriptional regulator [Saccharomonospora marina XMU15]|uniref:Transcriptional regulator n=1 Tax=Saccharomonospora marina XMU15 TaxID=882083 RepID=H5X1E3_9PSEU|nr:TetR/AcrR family transcriptional regulator [Saccharomonospora marina]EHR49734.1 transcriptional regulator [Saccharomonospora marina XMU15]
MGRTGHGTRQLPPGRHGFTRDYVAENQRARILTAVAQAVAEHGYPDLTVESVVERAGVSRKTFYEHFKNKEEAFLAAYDDFAADLVEQVKRANKPSASFSEQAEAILRTILELFAEHPAQAQLVVVEVLAAGPRAVRRRNDSLKLIVEVVNRGTCTLAEEQGMRPPPAITAETVVGGLLEVIYSRVERREAALLPSLLPDLMYCALLPYVGPAAAGAEHARLSSETRSTHT